MSLIDAVAPVSNELSEILEDWSDWRTFIQRTQGETGSFASGYDLLGLGSWPPLGSLPQDALPAVARICALLARKPTTASLIPLILDIPESEVFPIIELLRRAGHVRTLSRITSAADEPSDGNGRFAKRVEVAETDESDAPLPPKSLVAKLWQRLVAGS